MEWIRNSRLLRPKPLLVVLAFALANAGAWLWVRHDLEQTALATVRLVAALPHGDVDGAEKLTLVLDRPLGAAHEGMPPPRADLFRISPEPTGRWAWAAPDRLEYVLAEELPPGRTYRVRPSDEFELLTGRTFRADDEIVFRTRALGLGAVRASMVSEDVIELTLEFNQPVLPRELEQNARIHDPLEGVDLGFSSTTRDAGETLVLRTSRPTGDQLTLLLSGNLAGHGADRTLGADIRRSVSLPRKFGPTSVSFGQFRIAGPNPDMAGAAIYFSAALDRSGEPPRIDVEPVPDDFSVEWSRTTSAVLLNGEFRPGFRYHLTVPAGMLAADGRVQKESHTLLLEIPDRAPEIVLSDYRGILSPDGNLELGVRLVNVPRLRFRAWRVHANNLVPRLQGHRIEATTRELALKEFDVEAEKDRVTDAALSLAEALGQPLGLYRLEISAADNRWVRARAVVAVSDLAITAKAGPGATAAWVTSIATGRPVAGAEVEVLTYTNQVLGSGLTGEDGFAEVEIPANHPDGAPWLVTVTHEDDLGYLELDRAPFVLDDVDQSGRAAPRGYDVFLYTERGVYRPGDTVHLTGVVREPDGAVPEPFPLTVTVVRPDGVEIADITTVPGTEGVFHAEFATSEEDRTGPWMFKAHLPGSRRRLGTTTALVEAFVPARIELEAAATKDTYGPDESPAVSLSARYLFGMPATDLPVTATWSYTPEDFESVVFPDHRFTSTATDVTSSGSVDGARLDESGESTIEIPPPPRDRAERLRLSVGATVTEPGSRSVSKNLSAVVDRAPRYVGVRPPVGGWAPIGEEHALSWVARTPGDQLAPDAVFSWTLYRIDRDWVIREHDGDRSWQHVEDPALLARGTSEAAAEGEIPLNLNTPGLHRLEIEDELTGIVTSLEFHAAANESAARALALASPERMEIVPDRERYEPGETATVLLESPFSGTLLLTLETNRVEFHEVREIESGAVTVSVPIPETLRGGAYIAASVVRAADPDAKEWLPVRAAGLARIETDHRSGRLTVDLDAPENARPGERISVRARASGGKAVVHLFAVDEGILLTAATKTPDPHAHYFAHRRLDVTTNDLFPDLIPDARRSAGTPRIGGGAEEMERLRRNPVPTRRREAAVVWLEAVETDDEGEVVLDLTMPDLVGAVRIMAVAVSGDRYGSNESRVVLADPVSLAVGWPRFLAPGDTARVPVKIVNRTAEDRTVEVTVMVDGPADCAGTASLPVAAGSAETHWFTVMGTGIGPVDAVVTARSGTLETTNRASFPVRPAGPLHSETRLLRIAAGDTIEIPPAPGFLPGARRRLSVSASPSVELRPALERLLDYPYGCVEQTTSRLMAIFHAPELLEGGGDAGEGRAGMARDMIQAGIARLGRMQTPSGGLAYWPDGERPNRWGTAYAASFLALAEKAGIELPNAFMDRLLGYMEKVLHSGRNDRLDLNDTALYCRVLAAFDRPPTGFMARLSEEIDRLDMAGRAHLASAWSDAGRPDLALAALTEGTLSLVIPISTGGRITSGTRQEAVLLQTLLEIAPDHEWVPVLVERLLTARKSGAWRSTLEDATSLAALLSYQVRMRDDAAQAPDFDVFLTAGEREWRADHREPLILDLGTGDETLVVRSAGRGVIHVVLSTEGLAEAGRVAGHDRAIKVRRQWFGPTGAPLGDRPIRVGDLIRVEVTLESPTPDPIANIAIVDALPAGFEVENPRLATSAVSRVRRKHNRPARVEFLDDRVVLFPYASTSARTFGYTIRATTEGRFALPPIQASCMYEPAISSIHGEGEVRVHPR